MSTVTVMTFQNCHNLKIGKKQTKRIYPLTVGPMFQNANIHPSQNRVLTPRECARLQGFPDAFALFGSAVDKYKQVCVRDVAFYGDGHCRNFPAAFATSVLGQVENFMAGVTSL